MRRVIQKTVTTTKVISLTITHSEEEVHYALTDSVDQLDEAEPPRPAEAAPTAALESESDQANDKSTDTGAMVDTLDTPDHDKVAGE